jgi:hypothetical protein
LIVLVLAGVGYWNYTNVSQAQRALCTLRQDFEGRVQSSRDYLYDLDTGRREPLPGITRADIVTGIKNQERTIRALGNLDCT